MSDTPEILENLLVKARRSFEAAESLLEDGHTDFATSCARKNEIMELPKLCGRL